MLCDYGCGNNALFQFKNKKWCCSSNHSKCSSTRARAISTHRGYDYHSLPDEIKDRISHKGATTYTEEEIFKENTHWGSEFLRKYIHHFNILEYKCSDEDCGIIDWKNKHLVLELDHINGKRTDNRKENLRWLCPNCHSQTDTFRGRNKNPGKKKVSDEELLTALQSHSNIRQALQSVGLAAKGGNYERAVKLQKKLTPGW